MVMVIYDADRVLVTNDDVLPMVEIDENYACLAINNDLQFLMKVRRYLLACDLSN